jgi:hypothetical protein
METPMVREEDFETKADPEPKDPGFKMNIPEMEAARRAQWRGAVEQELQLCVQEAAGIRKKITDAKTKYKKEFYQKKFTKIQTKVMQMVAALQRLQAQEAQPRPAPAPHVHDEHCNHEQEEQNAETPETAKP